MKTKYEWFHPEDDLLNGMTFQELITTIHCDEPKRDRATVEKVFNELLEMKVESAKEMFNLHYKDIKKELTI